MKRLHLGKRGTEYGLWLTRPGVDLDDAGDGDFLVEPNSPHDPVCFFLKGAVTLAANATQDVLYGFTLSELPACIMHYVEGTSNTYDNKNLGYITDVVKVTPMLDRVRFKNAATTGPRSVRFQLFSRPES